MVPGRDDLGGAQLQAGQLLVEQQASVGAAMERVAGELSGQRPAAGGEPAARLSVLLRQEGDGPAPGPSTASWNCESRCTQTSASIGSSETEVKELAVIAWSRPSAAVVTRAMPVA